MGCREKTTLYEQANNLKKIYSFGIIFLFAAFTLGAVAALEIRQFARNPIGAGNVEMKIVISPGQSFKTVINDFKKAGLLKNPIKFKLLARITGADKQIRTGEYLFSTCLTPARILQKMVSGEVVLYRLTIPEGYTLAEVAGAVELSGLGSQAGFLAVAGDKTFVENLGIGTTVLEGYLFPDTYFFPKNVSAKQTIAAMITRFKAVFTPQWEKRAADLGFTVHQIVTLASIIEKETGDPDERPLIASVFHNRMNRGMRLETDPAVIYGIKNFNGNITRQDLKTPTPYNTYVIFGLPPGPIANPGVKSLEAALYPAASDFLYFVSKKNGTHQFSTNLNDHTLAVRKYQLSGKNSE
jgi:UPF0755 protein